MASAPLQRVRIAHFDHSTAGRRQTTFLTRQLWRASKEVHWKRQTIGKSAWRLTMQKGVGASPKGQRRPERPTTAGRFRKPFLSGRSRRAAWDIIWSREAIGIASGQVKRKMESVPLQRVRVAHCDHSTAGRRRTQSLTRKLRRASLEVQWSRQGMRKAFKMVKRQDGVGASPKGQGRPVRPYNSWKAPDDISDQEPLESNKRGPYESARRSESILEGLEGLEARRSLSIFTGSLSHMATTRHREGARRRS